MSERIKKIFSNVTEECDAVVLMNGQEPILDSSLFYACEIDSGLFEECVAVLKPDGHAELITSELEETAAKKSPVQITTYKSVSEKEDAIKFSLQHCKKIGINSKSVTYNAVQHVNKLVPDIEVFDAGPALAKTRMIKDAKEITQIREACRIASDVADMIPEFLEIGKTEYELAAEINYNMQKKGASSTSFDTIAAFGKNAAEPHHSPGQCVLKSKDASLFDFGCRVSRYCSDITRTFSPYEESKKFEDVYNVVLDAQMLAIESIEPGKISADIDKVARDRIDSTEYKGKMIHSLGHGLGLDVHDGGSFSPRSKIMLEENMVMTVEPGIYLPIWGGIRIEDDILVTKNGCEVLTHAKKDIFSASVH